jgi:transcriptional regulator with XRE-family HTH domain
MQGGILSGREYSKALGERLRDIRLQKGMSLQDVQEASGGRWKAAVVGAYERGDRNVTVARLSQLADFYGIGVPTVLPEDEAQAPPRQEVNGHIVLDLEELGRAPGPDADAVERFASAIQVQRGDYNGRVLSLRKEDAMALALLYELSAEEFEAKLKALGLLAR